MINVLDGPTAAEGAVVSNDSGVAKRKVSVGEQFEFIKLKTKLAAVHRLDFLGSGLFYSLLFAPFLIIPIIVMVRKKKEAIDGDVVGKRHRLPNRLPKKNW